MEDTALKLFTISDIERKGFIVKRDMQRMMNEVGLTSEQLEDVFDSLDSQKNGYLTLDQFLNGFRKYEETRKQNLKEIYQADFENHAEDAALSIIKDTNILKTSWDSLASLNKHMKESPFWDTWGRFLNELKHDIKSCKDAILSTEHAIQKRESAHQIEIQKLFEDVEDHLKDVRQKEKEITEQVRNKLKEEINKLQKELSVKDDLNHELKLQCESLNLRLQNQNKQENFYNSHPLVKDEDKHEQQLEIEKLKRYQLEESLQNLKRRFSIEKNEYFNDGYNLARKITNVQEQNLLQQLEILHDIRHTLSK